MKKNREQTQRLVQFWVLSLLVVTLSLLLTAWSASVSHTKHNQRLAVETLVQLIDDQYQRGVTLEQMQDWLPDLLAGFRAEQLQLELEQEVVYQWLPDQIYNVGTAHYRRELSNGLTLKLVLKRPQLLPAFSAQEWLLVAMGLAMALGMVVFGRRWLRAEMAGVELLVVRATKINAGDFDAAATPVRGERPLSAGRALTKLHRQWRRERSAKLELDRQIRANASLDPESGLGNRMFFDTRLASLAPNGSFRSQGMICLLQFNGLEALTPPVRLWVLQEFIDICQPLVRPHTDAVFARLHWLELGLVVPMLPLKEADALIARLHQLSDRLNLPEGADSERLLHIGAAYFSRDEPLEQALEEAEQALRAAQLQGESNWFMYDKGAVDRELAQGSVRWRSLLDGALRRRDFVTLFQPIVDGDGQILSREMFSRIRDHQGNILRASLYRPMARRCGLIPMVERELLALALQQAKAQGWREPVMVNLAFEAVLHPRFGKSIMMLLANYSVRRTQLIIEVNERELVQYADQMVPLLKAWHRAGVQLSVDGVGYTVEGAHYIDDLPLNWLKLHPSLVHQIDTRRDSQLVITSLRQVVSHQPLKLVAEGVECEEESRCLLRLGVAGVQGDYIGKAILPQ
ncbi:EAL domain-containing protein [Ferrimonas pelagia]|uniref:RNase E specificity factor CsrD n=1 Tax=Ferrimonas pelagia TaxID=1177826 RepID=A0ABP9FG41_9GAMM